MAEEMPLDDERRSYSFTSPRLYSRPDLCFRRDDAGVVYVASLLFDDSMMTRLSKCVVRLREGARVISLRPIPAFEPSMAKDSQRKVIDGNAGSSTGQAKRRSEPGEGHPVLRLLHEGVFRMSWQMARVYIYVRL